MSKRFLEAPQLADFLTRNGPYVAADLTNGVVITSFYEVEDAKLAEGLDYLGNYFTIFFGVPGFKYEYKVNFPVEKALKMIGMG